MTDAENMLWLNLRKKQLKGHQFYRQKNIGKYIVDFYCPKANLVIELDGGQHYSEAGEAKDRARDDVLKEMGLKVLRFSDWDVLENIGGVMEGIWSCQRGGKKKRNFAREGNRKGSNAPFVYT